MEVVVEMLKNKQAGILRASRALLGSTAECREPRGCLAQQHRMREKHIRSAEEGRQTRRGPDRSSRYSEQVSWLEPVRQPDHVKYTAAFARKTQATQL